MNIGEPPNNSFLNRTIRVQFVLLFGMIFLGAVQANARLLVAGAATSLCWGLFIIHGRSRGWWEEVKKDDKKPS